VLEDEVAMNEVTNRRRPSAAFLIKILIVLLFPLQGVFSSPNFGWISILLLVGGDTIVAFASISYLLVGLIIMLPCLIFEHHLNSRPISKSVRRRAAAACILSWFISLLLLRFGGALLVMSPFYITVLFAPILSISFFVILPLISRESTMLSIPIEHRTLSYSTITSTLHKRIRRGKILSVLLWIGIVFIPFMVYVMPDWNSYRFQFLALSYQYSAYSWFPWYEIGMLEVTLNFNAHEILLLPAIVLLSTLRLVFVRDVFRFQTGRIAKSRLASVALLGEILPSAIITLTSLISSSPGYYFHLVFPFPILPIIGFAYIRFSKIIIVRDEIWTHYEHRMWFDKEQDLYAPASDDESITVPITYLLVSQIRKRRKG
jgi:hypothetical protein